MKKLYLGIFILLSLLIGINTRVITSVASSNEKTSQGDQIAEENLIPLLNALKNRDKESMYSLLINKKGEKSTDDFFEYLFDLWGGVEFTGIKKISEKDRPAKGDTPNGTTYQYSIESEKETISLEFTIAKETKKIDQINIQAESRIIQTKLPPMQLILGVVSAAEIILTIYVAYLCTKRKPRLWGIWAVCILIFYGGVAISTKSGLSLSFFVYTFEFSKIVISQNKITQISISVPIAAIAYLVKFGNHSRGENKKLC